MRVAQVYFLAYWLFQDSLPPASNCNFWSNSCMPDKLII